MDFSNYLPDGLPQIIVGRKEQQQHGEERKNLEQSIENYSIQIHDSENELFNKMVHKHQLDTSIETLKTMLLKLSQNMATKVQRQNNLAGMVNTEQTKQKALQQRAELAMERIKENKDRIHENRCRVDGFGDYAVKFHDSIQSISCEISGLDEELRQFRAREGELVKLNVALASAETELRETFNSIKVTQIQIAKMDVRHNKYTKDIEVLAAKKGEVEANLHRHLDEKLQLQKELEGFSMENKLVDKLDEVDVALERHATVMLEIQAQHEEEMRVLQQQMRESVQKNEAFRRALDELDGTLALQLEELQRTNDELKQLTSGARGVEGDEEEDEELQGLRLGLEQKKCAVNQLEEKIMHVQGELKTVRGTGDAASDRLSTSSSPVATKNEKKAGARKSARLASLGAAGDTMTTLRSVTRTLSCDGNHGLTTKSSQRRASMSFESNFSIPSTIQESTLRTEAFTPTHLDIEVSSTQG